MLLILSYDIFKDVAYSEGYTKMVWLVEGISVPTGKETPIEPAKPTVRPQPAPGLPRAPAPVHEYTEDNPEPPPLHPSYVPVTYDYLNALAPSAIYYVPLRIKNIASYNSRSSSAPQEPSPVGATYLPVRTLDYTFPMKPAYQEQAVYFHSTKLHPKKPYLKNVYNKKYTTEKVKYSAKSTYPKKAIQHQNNYLYYLNNNN